MARLIDADALIEKINQIKMRNSIDIDDFTCGKVSALNCAIDIIRDSQAVDGWISVKDELPEEHADEHQYEFEQFLCSTVWDDVRMVGFGTRIGDDKPHFWSGNSIWDDWVTHWMPLPEPPKEDNNG